MKKFIVLVIIGIAAWQAWKHYPSLFERRPAHEAVIQNRSQRGVVKLKLNVGGQTLVRESIENDQDAVIPFRVTHDATFAMEWDWKDGNETKSWHGGSIPAGPAVQRYTITIEPGGSVFYRAEPKVATP